jgi:predicted phage-related endonuclease
VSATKHTATAAREGRWWVVTVEGVGVTQARTLRDAPAAARGLVSAMLDVEESDVDVEVTPSLAGDLAAQVRNARKRVADAERERAAAAAASRDAARALIGQGLSGADAATILGVSPQRVSQLIAS